MCARTTTSTSCPSAGSRSPSSVACSTPSGSGSKEQLIASQLQAIPPDVPADERAAGERLTRAAIDAQFYAVLAGIPRYVTDTEDVYVKDPDADKQVAEAWGEIAGVLGFDIGVAGDEEEK
jgi:hypothetical protein